MIQSRHGLNNSIEITPQRYGLKRFSQDRELAARFDYRVLKRLLDILLSSVILVLTAPLLLLIAGAIKASSVGPSLFKQRRVGMKGRIFWMYKFRTMKTSSSRVSEQGWTREQDTRVTCLGRILRRCSFDELPQLYNVVKGEMSLVGPRPERPHFVERFNREIPEYPLRHTVQCGITGWAQVKGWRGDTSIHKRLEHDLFYRRHWSLWFDLKILVTTLWRGFFHPNAY